MRSIRLAAAVLLFLLVFAGHVLFLGKLAAQTDRGTITGAVTDASGAAVPNVDVSVRNERTAQERKVKSNEAGHYSVTNLHPSSYSIQAQAPGLGRTQYANIPLTVGQEGVLNLILQPAALTQEVNVSGGELTAIDTSSARIGANVNEREVASLPLNGRQLSQLYLLAPGAQTAGGGSFDNIRFSGRANQENAVRFDGIEASSIIDASPGNLNGEISTGFRLQNSLETVAEF